MSLGTAGATARTSKWPKNTYKSVGGSKRREPHLSSRAVKDPMRKPWTDRGMPKTTLDKKGLPGYADAGTGTPGYIRAAADRAEARIKSFGPTGRQQIVEDCGRPNHGLHRLHDNHFDTGKPDRGRNVAVHMKPENTASNPDKKTEDKKRLV
jgi:hypothetical protein